MDAKELKLVPVEPTDAMQAAGAQAVRMDTTVLNRIWTANAVFRAMVEAAPSALSDAAQAPVAWVRFLADGLYEGPIMNCDKRRMDEIVRVKPHEWTALIAAPVAAQAPQGWKLVPVELTDEMRSAANKHDKEMYQPTWASTYRAMLAAAPTPTVAADAAAPSTGHAEADRIINRLMSSDPEFDDCADAADLIRKLIKEKRELSKELQAAAAPPDETIDAQRYRKCREHAVKRGFLATPEQYDDMVDESIERMEVAFRTGHNYGKKMQPDGTLKSSDPIREPGYDIHGDRLG